MLRLKKTRMLTPVPGERFTDSTFRIFLFCFAVFGVFGLGQAFVEVGITLLAPRVGPAITRLIALYATVFTVAGVLVWCLRFERRTLTTLGFIRRGAIAEYLVGIVLGVLLIALSLAICLFSGSAILLVPKAQPSILTLGAFLGGFLIQGLSEEMLCRSQLMVSLSRKRSLWFCAISNALFFALLHIANPGVTVIALFNIFLFGLFASLLVIKRGSIWMAAAIHSLWNFAQGNLFGIPVSGLTGMPSPLRTAMPAKTLGQVLLNGGSFGLEGGLAVTAVLTVAVVVVLLIPTKKSELAEDSPAEPSDSTDEGGEDADSTPAPRHAKATQKRPPDDPRAASPLSPAEPVPYTGHDHAIFAANKSLYERLIATPDLEGAFTFDGRFIRWERPCPGEVYPLHLTVSVHQCDLESDYMPITHWHPEDEGDVDALYAFLCEAGRPGHVLVARKTGPVFVGKREDYEADESLKNRMVMTYIFG